MIQSAEPGLNILDADIAECTGVVERITDQSCFPAIRKGGVNWGCQPISCVLPEHSQ